MTNVVNIAAYRKPTTPQIEELVSSSNDLPSEAIDFVHYLYEWAMLNNVNVQTLDFKYSAATITSVIQGMLATR